jgi:hypothetical protein
MRAKAAAVMAQLMCMNRNTHPDSWCTRKLDVAQERQNTMQNSACRFNAGQPEERNPPSLA